MKRARSATSRLGAVALAVGAALGCLPSPAAAVFHFWQIKEIYSNADGSIQYVELFTASDFQEQVGAHTIVATSDALERTFTFSSNLSTNATANRHLLIATPGFARLPGAVTPDFTLPCGPFFDPEAESITIDFPGADSVTFAGADLPIDGTNSLTDSILGGPVDFESGPSSPTSFTGSAGALALTGCLQAGTCEACDDGFYCNGPESCSMSACAAGTPPCIGMCVENGDVCQAEAIELDVDANGSTDALTDGLLALRHAFNLSGTALTGGAVGAGCVRCDAAAIAAYLGGLGLTFDVDDTDSVAALTDGLLVLRYLFGLDGTALTGGVVGQGCGRCDATTIVPYLLTLDID